MITYDEAYKKAKELKDNIDNVEEYENGWVFGCYDDENFDGGGHTPVVICRDDGEAINMPQFIVNGTGKHIKTYEL